MGNKDSPAYYVVIKKDKKLKAFYWMVNSAKSYSLLHSMAKAHNLNMTADKAPSVELTEEIKGYLDTAVKALQIEDPSITKPSKPVELCEVLKDLINKDLIKEDSMGESLQSRLEELKRQEDKEPSLHR